MTVPTAIQTEQKFSGLGSIADIPMRPSPSPAANGNTTGAPRKDADMALTNVSDGVSAG